MCSDLHSSLVCTENGVSLVAKVLYTFVSYHRRTSTYRAKSLL